VIALASGTQVGSTTGRGLLLIVAYCLGLGLPFILLALGARWAVGATTWIRRHIRQVIRWVVPS
jgi:cytochrome c-type biogenesis protein